ncbi:MAG: spore cortex-lytic enzyme [Bacillota bacterium]
MGRKVLIVSILLVVLAAVVLMDSRLLPPVEAQHPPTLYWGSQGSDVITLQTRLQNWGYYDGPISGVFGAQTSAAVRQFQRVNGLPVDGLVGPQTWAALGVWVASARTEGAAAAVYTPTTGVSNRDDLNLLTRVVAAEAGGEPYTGQVAVAAVILNRIKSPSFPNSLAGVIYQPLAFESVSNGLIWRISDLDSPRRAAQDAMNGWDPTYGSIYFWNPGKPVNPWVWTRTIVTQIGRHVFAR